jgi:transcriptional coactivator HFI1/ADA1
LNQAELTWELQPLLSPAPSVITGADPNRSPVSTLHLHNTLIAALYANISRDPPPTDVAPWVVATDKPTAAAKNAGASGANDKAEERLKKETMMLHARDRRRIKNLKDNAQPPISKINDGLRESLDYHWELIAKPQTAGQDAVPQSAGGLGKSNWDHELRRRYAQPLASETLEFPTIAEVQNRIEPIAAEEGLVGSTQTAMHDCATFVQEAAEVYLKEMLESLIAHSRSNGEGCIQTGKFKRQLAQEEDDTERGVLQRAQNGLLPAEQDALRRREPLDLQDMRIGYLNKDLFLRRDRFAEQATWDKQYPDPITMNGFSHAPVKINGATAMSEPDAPSDDVMDVDDMTANSWTGGTTAALGDLMTDLDDFLTAGG